MRELVDSDDHDAWACIVPALLSPGAIKQIKMSSGLQEAIRQAPGPNFQQ